MIEDYYRELKILKATKRFTGTTNIKTFVEIGTVQGAINQKSGMNVVNGKTLEQSIYRAYTEIDLTITKDCRLQDTDGKIYRLKGSAKNTFNLDHHYRFDLELRTEDN